MEICFGRSVSFESVSCTYISRIVTFIRVFMPLILSSHVLFLFLPLYRRIKMKINPFDRECHECWWRFIVQFCYIVTLLHTSEYILTRFRESSTETKTPFTLDLFPIFFHLCSSPSIHFLSASQPIKRRLAPRMAKLMRRCFNYINEPDSASR